MEQGFQHETAQLYCMNFFYHFGKYLKLLASMFTRPERFSMYWKETMRQMNQIGVGSLSIVIMISFFLGAVTAVQTAFQLLGSFIPQYYVGYIVRDTMLLELAPTITCLVLAGKVGSNLASELGTMRISEQIDALEIMGVNTSAYLVGPKLIAAVITIPLLVIFSAALGMLGGYAAVAAAPELSNANYIKGLTVWFDEFYLTIMLTKSVVFAFILTSISSYLGYYVQGGALEIGKASTRAVVYGSVMILVADYFIAMILT
jgi:phospholipid/cholesterol/gamma-HCH transport system permease protein